MYNQIMSYKMRTISLFKDATPAVPPAPPSGSPPEGSPPPPPPGDMGSKKPCNKTRSPPTAAPAS